MNVSSRELMPLVKGALERGQKVRLTVSGSSMLPLLVNDDVVEIEPVIHTRIGDMVLVQVNSKVPEERYVLHRIVRISDDSQVFIRGDAQNKSEGPFSGEAILGKVTTAWRNGKPRQMDRGFWFLAGLAWMRLFPVNTWLLWLALRLRRFGGRVLARLQCVSFYRGAAKAFCPEFIIQEANQSDPLSMHTWFHSSSEQDIPVSVESADSRLTNYIARSGSKIIGFVRLIRYAEEDLPYSGYWLYSLTIKRRYRGMGIGEALTRQVIEQSKLEGASELWLSVFEDNRPAIIMYEKLGFKNTVLPVLEAEFAADVKLYGRQRITMKKELT